MVPSARKPGSSSTSSPTDPRAAPLGGRLALGLEYDGSAFAGWQNQSHAPSVQRALNAAIAAVADGPVSTAAAGRTDAGVHATGQVVHFDAPAVRSLRSWLLGINSNLPAEIAVLWIRQVPGHFHARHSATARMYRYVILNRPVRSALERHRAWWVRESLDVAAMAAGAQFLVGEHDFSAFRAASCQARSPVRHLSHLEVVGRGQHVVLEFQASGFLQHMVRNLVGSLVRVGHGLAEPGWLRDLLASRDRRQAAPTAPAEGLYLRGVRYPAEFGLPAAADTDADGAAGMLMDP